MRSVISKSGGNASLAGERWKVWRSPNGHEAKAGHSQGGPAATTRNSSGGQGVHREVESEGHAEKYRAVIDGGTPRR